jgi:hypothetical protein
LVARVAVANRRQLGAVPERPLVDGGSFTGRNRRHGGTPYQGKSADRERDDSNKYGNYCSSRGHLFALHGISTKQIANSAGAF